MRWFSHNRGARVNHNDGIRWIVDASGTTKEAMLEADQYCESGPDGKSIDIWQDSPADGTRGRALVYRIPIETIRWLLKDEEAALLWDCGCLRTKFGAGSNVRTLILKNGLKVQAHARQFFQTSRDGTHVEAWQMRNDTEIRFRGEWYPVPSDHVQLIGKWPVDSVLWIFTDAAIEEAHSRGLLRDVLDL